MRRKSQISGYTRKVGGKTVVVKPHSRMTGKEGVNTEGTSAKPGEEYESHQPGRAGEADYEYKPGKYAYMSKEEWDAMAREAAEKRSKERGALRDREPQSVYGKKANVPAKKKSSRSEKYSSMEGIVGDINRFADKLAAYAESHKRRK